MKGLFYQNIYQNIEYCSNISSLLIGNKQNLFSEDVYFVNAIGYEGNPLQ